MEALAESAMHFDGKYTLVLAILTLFLGKFLNSRMAFLRTYNIPEPVTGGVLASVVFATLYSLSGGHGTAIAWTPIFQDEMGIANAKVIGIAVATFGLVIGGIIGGPLSQFLIDVDTILLCMLVIAITMGIGFRISDFGDAMGLKLPDFVGALFAGIILTNIVPVLDKSLPWPSGSKSLALISDVSLSLFLAMSLMSLQLWAIVAMAGPLILLLLAQLAMISAFVIFVIFPLMGRNYDAAVMAGGYAGLGLGATPTAVANMTAVTRKCSLSPLAFLIVPLEGAFFIDIANAAILKGFIGWLS